MDIADKIVPMNWKTFIIVICFLAGGIYGYFRLEAKASDAADKALATTQKLEEASKTMNLLQCDVRQLKNFMIYNVKPSPLDRCDGR